MSYILGISAYYHDSAAALLKDGVVVAAAQEERFSRKKNDEAFPEKAIQWLLKDNQITMADIDHVIFYEKPFNKFERIIETCIRFSPKGYSLFKEAMPLWLKEKLFQKIDLKKALCALPSGEKWNGSLLFSDHHLSHSAAAFYPSPFESAAIITIDGVGEWATTTISVGRKNTIEHLKELKFPHSFGMLYSAITAFLGFKVNSGEYKVMGLAPYGQPIYADLIKAQLIDIKDDGSFRLNMRYFRFATELTMFGPEMAQLFGTPARLPEGPLEQVHMDIAASLQLVIDELFIKLACYARQLTGEVNLCLAGGVALNCVATGKVQKSGIFDAVWIQPSAGDAGSALGAAQVCWYVFLNNDRVPLAHYNPYLGPDIVQQDAVAFLDSVGARYRVLSDDALYDTVSTSLAEGNIVAWVQGRAEFSPRALCNRSILADPRGVDLKRELNLKIKFRESFRPFAPVILEEDAQAWFDIQSSSPFMNFICTARDGVKEKIPSVIHLDNTARLQTVSALNNARFYPLLSRFKAKTACPVLVNTSLNVRGEPMVLSPEDAFNCFMNTGIDQLVIGNILLDKVDQDNPIYSKNNYTLD